MDGVSPQTIEPVAIIGMGCRMPGDIRSSQDLWRLLMSKGIANMEKVPLSRFNVDAYLHPNNERPGSFNVPGGYFLKEDPYNFDPSMFKISAVEASCMDPQQRLLLEVVYEAFESSGTPLNIVSGRKTGCFIGSFIQDSVYVASGEPDFAQAYTAIGVDPGILGNRISFVFNLKGPSLTVNTACSSSMYALDLACKAMYSGDCDSAIVGGTNLIITVNQHMNTAKMGVLSPTNQCHTFDASADGYGRSEAIGALYLKPLSAALRDGDPIRAIIRSTAVSNNGKGTDGITMPSKEGQVEVIHAAYRLAGLSPDDTAYVECHGTGTPVGDPIEVEALHKAFGELKPLSNPILIGSVKPNVGHSEAASSMATLIKAVMALEQGIIPPTAGIFQLNPNIPWSDLNVQVVSEPTRFPASEAIQRISVNAFGYGGTNAHAIVESTVSMVPGYRAHKLLCDDEAVCDRHFDNQPENDQAYLLVFSAHNEVTLRNNLRSYSEGCCRANLIDLAYTLGTRRTKFSCRTFAVAHQGTLASDIQSASDNIGEEPRGHAALAYVFTGQGAQWVKMGAALMSSFPSALQTIRHLDEHLGTLKSPPAWKLETLLMTHDEAIAINEPEFSQPSCTALQIAIVNLLDSWGLEPTATVGHSSGELASAYASGIISAEEAITLAYYRGKAVSLSTDRGAMLSVGLGVDEARDYILDSHFQGRLEIACHNSPNNTTISGNQEDIQQLKEILETRKIFARILRTGGKAYHSHYMREVATTYRTYLDNESIMCCSRHYRCPMFSTTKEKMITGKNGGVDNSYWVENLTGTVLFDEAVKLMLAKTPSINTLVEIGPHSVLEGPLRQICQAINTARVIYLPTLKRNGNGMKELLKLAGHLWMIESSIDMRVVTSVEKLTQEGEIEHQTGSHLVNLPTYQWTYTNSYRSESRVSKDIREMVEQRHDILGRQVNVTSTLKPVWRNILRQRDLPWLSQHRIGGEVLFPATGYLALAIEAITQINSQSTQPLEVESYTLRDVLISSPTVIPDDDSGTEIIFHLHPMDGKAEFLSNGRKSQWYSFSAINYASKSWKESARGRISLNMRSQASNYKPRALPVTPLRSEHADWLERGRQIGVDLGPAFDHIGYVYADGQSHTARGEMNIGNTCGLVEAESRYVLHPGVLDACLQIFNVAIHKGQIETLRCGRVPTHIGELTLFSPSSEQLANPCKLQAWSTNCGVRANISHSQLFSYDDSLLVEFLDCRTVEYLAALPPQMQGNLQQDLYLKYEWKIDIDYLQWIDKPGISAKKSVANLVDTILHKDIALRTLCLEDSLFSSILSIRPTAMITILGTPDNFQTTIEAEQAANVVLENIGIEEMLLDSQSSEKKFDLIVGPDMEKIDIQFLQRLTQLLVTRGRLILRMCCESADLWKNALECAGFRDVEVMTPERLILATRVQDSHESPVACLCDPIDGDRSLLLIYRDAPTSIYSAVLDDLLSRGWNVCSQSITSTFDILQGQQIVLLADTEGPLLAELDENQLRGLIRLAESASAIIWVTCGGLLSGDQPEYGMTEGIARVLRNEKGSLDLVTVDFDVESTNTSRLVSLVVDILERQRIKGRNGETEYCIYGDVVYVGRIVPFQELNCQFASDSGETTTAYQKDNPDLVGSIINGRLRFSQNHDRASKALLPDEVEVHVAAIGMTLLDGSDDADYLNHQIAGSVSRLGAAVDRVTTGSTVFGFAFDKLATFQRTSYRMLQVLPPGLSVEEAATLPSPFTTVLYGLEELARIDDGDNVVIVDGSGDVGLAALQICRIHQANAIVVTSSPTTKEFLLVNEGLSSDRIIDPRDSNMSVKLNEASGRKGIQVILCSQATDSATVLELGQALASSGRMVTFGSSQNWFPRTVVKPGTSYFHFELAELARDRPQVVERLLNRIVDLYVLEEITSLGPIEIKQPMQYSEIVQTIPRALADSRYVISYSSNKSFKVSASQKPIRFKPDATYLLVGGLGGIGRKIALWMTEREARRLAFVSRSGTDHPEAAQLVKLLRNRGVDVSVLRADVTCRQELAIAISQLSPAYPIRGVMNAAGVLSDAVFANMTFDQWHPVVKSKLRGNQNLHELLKDQELDFFVMTSSVSGFMGLTGQCNYAAANTYLDSLARHRRYRGLPAISLVLGAIHGFGYIHEHSLEDTLKLMGVYSLGETEMLDAFEIAMTPQRELPPDADHFATGLQPRRLGRTLGASGVYMALEEDARLNWLARAIETQSAAMGSRVSSSLAANQKNIVTTIRETTSMQEAVDIVTVAVAHRLARLLMIEEDLIQITQKSIGNHGLDSMIGAEFRNWIFREFKIDMPFQKLLAADFTLVELAKSLCGEIRDVRE
ncbi:ketoacyl-synt-domain-containing protein [Xylaria scruposa]|nr:ketoacyl-synt-domain-containing protein [Xylaria scruposa]